MQSTHSIACMHFMVHLIFLSSFLSTESVDQIIDKQSEHTSESIAGLKRVQFTGKHKLDFISIGKQCINLEFKFLTLRLLN